MRLLTLIIGLLFALSPLQAVTLERLTLDEMIEKSTEIVRGRVLSSRTAMRGPVVYSYVHVQVVECWKGPCADGVEVAVPGGVYGQYRQTISGAPSLKQDTEYVLFLWTGSSGLTQIIGLSQGVFNLNQNEEGEMLVERAPSQGVMLDANTGNQVRDEIVKMHLGELRERVGQTLAGAKR